MPKLNRFTAPLWDLDTFYVFSDFSRKQDDLEWVDTITDTGTVLMGDNVAGIAVLTPSDGTVADNDEVYLASANELFKLLPKRPIYGRCRLQFTETASGIYNAAFGFANAVAADLILDNGAGLRASGSIIAIEKRDGETTWRLTTRNGATVTSTLSTMTAGGANDQELEIEATDVSPPGGAGSRVVAKVNGEFLKDSRNIPIEHTILFASATEMQVFAGAKLGAITNNDVLNLHYIYAAQRRAMLVV
jgi:hypothetical protein